MVNASPIMSYTCPHDTEINYKFVMTDEGSLLFYIIRYRF